jgi:4-amino-4-deoxy-L-arabinose transferase-like glycosyltransferase
VLTLIVPVFNEPGSFPKLVAEVERHVPQPLRMLVVYDFDADTTLPIARDLARSRPWLQLVRNDLGRGPANAIRAGFAAAREGPALVVMADLSDDLSRVPELLDRYGAGYRIVCPSRYMRGGRQVGGPWLKRTLSRAAGLSLRWLARFPTHDATNNFRLYDAALVNELGIESGRGFEIALELTAKAFARGVPITEVPATWNDRTAGTSKFRVFQWIPNYLKWYRYALLAGWGLQPGAPRPRSSLAVLALIMAAFVVLRVPLMWRQPGGMDEEFYATPGLAILAGEVPRAPHLPQHDPDYEFYRADQAFFAEPPLSFYWQALFLAVLPDTFGAARLASGAAALVSIWLVYELGRTLYRSETAALWGAGLCSLARTFYIPAMMGWPYMLCNAFGLAAILCLARAQRRLLAGGAGPLPGPWAASMPLLALTGLFLGLGGLTHPLASVYAIQAAGWLLIASRGWRRLANPALVAVIASVVFTALWLPMIARYPDAFRGQFLKNWQSDSGVVDRIVQPWESLRWHAWIMTGPVGPLQFLLLLGGPALATALACATWLRRAGARRARTRADEQRGVPPPARESVASVERTPSDDGGADHGPLIACGLAWSSVYLLATLSGEHPTQYYWCYPTALLCVCLGGAIAEVSARIPANGRRRALVNCAGGSLLVAAMLPGAGLRTWLAHLRHWNDINYNAPAFAQQMLADLPADARYTVDRAFVLDFLADGRRTLLAETYRPHFSAQEFPYDYLIVSRYGLEQQIADTMRGTLVRTYGDRDDLFACYAEVYRPVDSADRWR